MKTGYILVIASLLISTQFSSQTFAAWRDTKDLTADDVNCDGCIGTADIENGAVTNEKLSTSLQQQINRLQTQVDTLERQLESQQILHLYDDDDNSIGTVIDVHFFGVGQDVVLSVINQAGFFYAIYQNSGIYYEQSLYFADDKCQTQAYLMGQDNPVTTYDLIFSAWHGDPVAPLYYVTRGTPLVSGLDLNYVLTTGGCIDANTETRGYPAYPNVPEITGASNAAPSLPLRLGF